MKLSRLIALPIAAVLALCAVRLPEKAPDISAAQNTVTFTDLDPKINGGEPIRGVDISSIISIENAGVKFFSDSGQEQSIFQTLSEHGVNYIRVRIWNEPNDGNGHSYGGGNSDLETAAEIGRLAAQYDMKLLVDIQYSDFWADPGKQTRPKYWQQHDHETLKGEIYKWTSWVLQYITENGGDIGMVQVGNETNCFFCGEKDMYKICDLFASGNKAVRDFDKNILIAHHFANPASGYYDWYAQVMNECKLDYDVFATSYYPYWHGTTENLTKVLRGIGEKYNKYVMVAETAYPYTDEDGDSFGNAVTSRSSGVDLKYSISVEGQAQCLTDVFQAVANCGSRGIGVFYWEPAWLGVPDISWEQQKQLWDRYGSGWATEYAREYDKEVTSSGGSSYDNQALFDFHGKPLESLDVFLRILPQAEKEPPKPGSVIPAGEYRIKNAETELYLTAANGEGRDNTKVVQYTADGAADYNTWYPVAAGEDGYYRIYSRAGSGDSLLTVLSQNATLHSAIPGDSQLFKFIALDNGSYIIAAKSSDDKDSLSASGSYDGSDVLLSAGSSQAWILEPIISPYIAGDLNSDGIIDVFDLVKLRKTIIQGKSLPNSDLNNDNLTNIADLVKLQRFLIGYPDSDLGRRGTPPNTIFPAV